MDTLGLIQEEMESYPSSRLRKNENVRKHVTERCESVLCSGFMRPKASFSVGLS